MIHSKQPLKHYINALTIGLASLASSYVYSDEGPKNFEETLRFSLGTSTTTYNMELTIATQDGSLEGGVDLEDDLGFDEDVDFYWAHAVWRFQPNHRFMINVLPYSRTSKKDLSENIEIKEDTIISAGASIRAESKLNIYDIDYAYSLFRNANTEVSLSAGIYWMSTSFRLDAKGDVSVDGGETFEFQESYEVEQNLDAPLPLLGLSATHYFLPNWETGIKARYLAAEFGEYTGRILSLNARTEYYFKPYIGVGIAVSTFDLKVDRDGVVLANEAQYDYSGVQLYLTSKF